MNRDDLLAVGYRQVVDVLSLAGEEDSSPSFSEYNARLLSSSLGLAVKVSWLSKLPPRADKGL